MSLQLSDDRWGRVSITCVEDLQDAVLGAGLDVVQLSRGPMSGSLAFAMEKGMLFSTGVLSGRVSLTGPLSHSMTTLGLGIRMAPGSRQWMHELESGGVGILHAGDSQEANYLAGSLYAAVTLSIDQLEEIAADKGLVLDAKQLGGSGLSRYLLSKTNLASLQREFTRVHGGGGRSRHGASILGRFLLDCLIEHLARQPRLAPGPRNGNGHERIVARAHDYITEHLETPLSIDEIARAAFASQSTLYRAFHEVLDETPQSFIRKMRLNRIRRALATEEEARSTITILANRWGVGEVGRFAGWYRELFGELPSLTRARRMAMLQAVDEQD